MSVHGRFSIIDILSIIDTKSHHTTFVNYRESTVQNQISNRYFGGIRLPLGVASQLHSNNLQSALYYQSKIVFSMHLNYNKIFKVELLQQLSIMMATIYSIMLLTLPPRRWRECQRNFQTHTQDSTTLFQTSKTCLTIIICSFSGCNF